MDEQMISKKELLELTGISYGQLYRWKRERLLPEEWFIKRSSYTGQETYFPREQVLERIKTIQELKSSQSLEEIAQQLGQPGGGWRIVLYDGQAPVLSQDVSVTVGDLQQQLEQATQAIAQHITGSQQATQGGELS
jgi:DNA-binding transcriptional MerR regulator